APPRAAGPADITFFDPRYCAWHDVAVSRAAAVIVSTRHAATLPVAHCLAVTDFARACARAAAWLTPRVRATGGRFPTASVAGDATIHPAATLATSVRIGSGSRVEAGVVLGDDVVIGDWCSIGPGAVIAAGVTIGNRVSIGAGSVVGERGFAFVRDGEQWLRMPTFGSVVIEDDVVILAGAVVHAGVFGMTHIGRGCALDSLVLIGHDARLGANTAIAGHSAVAGGANVGPGCRIGGRVAIGEGVTIADRVTVGACSMVSRSITQAGAEVASGWPAQPRLRWWRQVAALRRAAARPDHRA
ncbi:MAG: UDP-3-O-(3-hydroxymyristoyl)glucosamine N-acyltransferase, partial [Gammaproteobacteria bacterium]